MVEEATQAALDVENDDTQYRLSSEFVQALDAALDQEDSRLVREAIHEVHEADIAEYINQATSPRREALLDRIPPRSIPDILLDIDPKLKEEVIESLGARKVANAVAKLDIDDAVDLVEDLEEDQQRALLQNIPRLKREELEQGLSYPEYSAGRIMRTDVVSIPEAWDVGMTIDYLRANAQLADDFHEIYVVDGALKPVGAVQVSKVIRNKRPTKIAELMRTELHPVRGTMDQEEVAYLFNKFALVSTPVVDEDGALIGFIGVDDIVEVIEEEAEEDILRLAGVTEADIYAATRKTAATRFPWLFVNLLTAIAASAIIAMFEGSIEQIVALAVMMPIVASMGGNAGTQTLAVAVRSLATRELTDSNARRVLKKEVLVGALNGVLLAVICALVAFIYYQDLLLSLVFALAMVITLVAAGFAGTIIPLVLERMKIDPAIASSVFLTTVTDMVGFLAFLGIATWLLLGA